MRVVRIIMGESEMHSIRCRSQASKARDFSCIPLGNRTNVTLTVRSSAGNLWRASKSSLWHWRVFLNCLLVKRHCPAWFIFH